jgi:Kelch motif protein
MAGTWQGLINQPTFHTSTMILLSDGRVMVQEDATPHWHALTPDDEGNYVKGTWSPLADMAIWRRYYASGMLKDGRIILIGGEDSGAGGDTNLGQIYDPVSDTWGPLPSPPGWSQVGDAACCVFPDGRFMIGALLSGDCIIYDPTTNIWTPAAGQPVRTNEETWILLPDHTILTVECFPPYRAQKYLISADTWKDEGVVPVTLIDPVMSEIGPAMLMYDGKVIFFGAADSAGFGKTAIYTPPPQPWGTGTWAAGPDIPKVGGHTMVCNDCPASLLPNGKVLVAAAPFQFNNWGSPISFFEYDPFTNSLSQAPTPPNNTAQLYWSRFMLTPAGQVLFSPSSDNVQCYTPDGGPEEHWRPTIEAVTRHGAPTDYYLLRGRKLNGFSQANIYGDDCSPATNYPLVRLKNIHTHEVYYCRTYDFSTMGVATGDSLQSVRFAAPHVPHGHYDLCVVANGISSHCVSLRHHKSGKECGCDSSSSGCSKCCCKEVCESRCEEESAIEPEILALKRELKSLQKSVHLLASRIRIEEPKRDRRRTHKDENDDDGKEKSKKKEKGDR